MRILGLDLGDKTIGVALSDPLGFTAQGKEVIERTTLEEDLQYLEELVEKWGVLEVVVGLPQNMDGSLGPRAQYTIAFVERLEERLSIPVLTYDERLTTVQAERSLISMDVRRNKRKKVIDKVAAVILLQSYLDSRREKEASDHGG